MDDWNNGFGTPRFSYKPENYQEYHGISADSTHTSDMDFTKIQGNIDEDVPVKSTRYKSFNFKFCVPNITMKISTPHCKILRLEMCLGLSKYICDAML